MTMTAEQSAALEQETLNAETQPTDPPASGEQPTTEQRTPPDGEQPADGEPAKEGEGDDEGDKPKEEAKTTPEQQRAWTQVAAAKKAQVQVAQARQKLNEDVARVRGYEGQLNQHRQQLETFAHQLTEREARLKPLETALANRDLNALVALGFDYETWTRDAMTANTPEGIARRALEDNKKLRQQIEDDKKAAEKASQQRAQVEETRSVANHLVACVDTYQADYPDLYQWTPDRIANEGLEIRAAHYRATRQMPTYAKVLDELQKRAKAENDFRTQRVPGQRKGTNPSDAGSAGKVDAKGASGSPGTPALTGATANQRPSPPREKTEEEIDEECRAMLRGLRR